MKKKIITTLLAAITFIPLLTGCNKGDFEIEFNPYAESGHVGQEYDFSQVIKQEGGVNYKVISANYTNYNEIFDDPDKYDGHYELEVRDNFKFTPIAEYPINVEVEATRGGLTKYRKYKLPVVAVGDPIDELLVTSGWSGWSDDGFSKKLNTNRALIKGQYSTSSIAVSFSGIETHSFGKAVLCPSNFRCLDYWTDKEWTNTILTFWVYNPTDYNFRFQLRLKDNFKHQIDLDWGQSLSVEQVALPQQWTQLFFSMHHYGLDHTLFVNEDGTRDDQLNIKVRWDGCPALGKSFEYTFFVDGLDFVPNTMYPFIDTSNANTSEQISDGLENLYIDNGMTSTVTKYDSTVYRADETHHSTSSLKLDFKGGSSRSEYIHNNYAVTFSPADSVIEGKIKENLDFTRGLFEFDIKFNDYFQNKLIDVILYRANQAGGWDNLSTRVGPDSQFIGDQNGWYHYKIDLATIAGIEIYDKTTVRFEISFKSVDKRFEDYAVAYIDNITLDNNGGTQPEKEDIIKEGDTFYNLENLPVDGGWSKSTSHYNYVNHRGSEHGNKRSIELDFSNSSSDAHDFYFIAFDTSAHECKDFQEGTLTADLYIPNANLLANNEVQLTLMNTSEWDASRETVLFTHPSGYPTNWYKVTFNYTHTNFNDVVRVAICFKGIREETKSQIKICVDNLTVKVEKPFINPETIADGYENLNHDSGWETCKNKMTNEHIYTKDYKSQASMKVTFEDVSPKKDNGYAVVFNNESQLPDLSFSNGTMTGDIYYEGANTPNIKVLVTDGGWKTGRDQELTLTKSNDWYHFSIKFSTASWSHEAEFDPSKVIRFGFIFSDVTEKTRDNYTYYLDNIRIVGEE